MGCKLPHILRRRNDGKQDEDDDEESGDDTGLREGGREGDASEGEVLGKRKGDRSDREGISGAAGRRLKKYKKDGELAKNDDFVTLVMPLTDDEDDEDEDDIEDEDEGDDDDSASVDSADLEDHLAEQPPFSSRSDDERDLGSSNYEAQIEGEAGWFELGDL